VTSGFPPIEFDGPTVATCFGKPYVALTSSGIKREGHPPPEPLFENEETAWAAFNETLANFKGSADQVAWRARPVAEAEKGGKWFIYSRLAVFP
jgi:hypothetical protein